MDVGQFNFDFRAGLRCFAQFVNQFVFALHCELHIMLQPADTVHELVIRVNRIPECFVIAPDGSVRIFSLANGNLGLLDFKLQSGLQAKLVAFARLVIAFALVYNKGFPLL